MTQYSIRPKRFVIRAQAVYFLHSTLPNVTCLRLTDVSRQRNLPRYLFSVFDSVCFSSIYRSPGRTSTAVLIRNIGHRTLPKIWVATFLVRTYSSEKKSELTVTVKMETRHPTDG